MDDLGKSFDEYTEKYDMCSETELVEELNTLYLKFIPRDANAPLNSFLSNGIKLVLKFSFDKISLNF